MPLTPALLPFIQRDPGFVTFDSRARMYTDSVRRLVKGMDWVALSLIVLTRNRNPGYETQTPS